jgi:copper chaperone CopZ
MTTYTVSVQGMTCEGCERIVERETAALDGVAAVDADADAGTVVVTGRQEAAETVRATIEALGYDVVN